MAFLGDSINHLVANAAECFAAQAGDWALDAGDAATHVTVRNAGCARRRLVGAHARMRAY